ncbi:MAG: hypothetical protein VX466_02340 [Myxococcota bacterium]|nr:hypothetical protein [Myxococcota bacterium]
MDSRVTSRFGTWTAHAGAGAVLVMTLVAVGQPIFTDDLWWHLALGEAHASSGAWLSEDPLLYTAAGPPSTAAWLSEVFLFEVFQWTGFAGLRILHVLTVAVILALAWSILRRASGSPVVASLLGMVFAALSAYRLVQLRPHLVSILAALILYRLLVEDGRPPSRARIALVAGLLVFWANAHAGFLLGPILIAGAAMGLLLAMPLRATGVRAGDRKRALGLGIACAVAALATLVNPGGLEPHLAYLQAGADTPNLLRVADDWLPIDLFALPVSYLPPSPFAWLLLWGLLLAVPLLALRTARLWREQATEIDPALVALAGISLLAMLAAVRFTWLGIFPLILLAQAFRGPLASRKTRGEVWIAAVVSIALAGAFFRFGDWPMISKGLRPDWARYKQPYTVAKYYAHATWVLRDAGVAGNLYNDYSMGGFLGFWLAPDVKAFVNGSLNVSPRVMEANRAVREYRGLSADQDLLELLDQEKVDLFFGIRLPVVPEGARHVFYTTTYLERSEQWIQVFRNVGSAIHLRRNERNRENLERIAAYYARVGVPFDSARGFEPERVLREARPWAIRRGLVPRDFASLAAATRGASPAARVMHQDRLASVYVSLGLYEDAVRLDRRTLRFDPDAESTRRRLVWSLLHLDRSEEAAEAAVQLAAPDAHPLSRELAAAVGEYASLSGAPEAAGFVARLPLWAPVEARWMSAGLVPPEIRLR